MSFARSIRIRDSRARKGRICAIAALLLVGGVACKDKTRPAARPAAQPASTPALISSETSLESLERAIVTSTDEQLLAMLHADKVASGDAAVADYSLALNGNQGIEGELLHRGLSARPALEAHRHDTRSIISNDGKSQTVGEFCAALLRELSPPPVPSRDPRLIMAAWNGDLPAVQMLLAGGADPNFRFDRSANIAELTAYPRTSSRLTALGVTPLQAVALSDRAKEKVGVARALIRAGAKVNLKDENDFCALDSAVSDRAIELAEYLLDEGADINARSSDGSTPIFSTTSNPKMLELLIARGANVNVKNRDGNSPLHHAAMYGEPDAVAKLLKAGADVNIRDDHGQTPLHLAVNAAIAQQLCAAGARLDLKDTNRFTPLMEVEWSVERIEREREPDFHPGRPRFLFSLTPSDLNELTQQGLSGQMLAHRLNDLRSTETREIAGVLKSAQMRQNK